MTVQATGDSPPLDACLVLLDRDGSVDLASAATGAIEGSGLSPRVLTVTAAGPSRAGARPPADIRLGAGAWWSTVLEDVLREVREELIVFLEVSALAAFDGAAALAGELAQSSAAAIAARILDPRSVTIAFDRGTFDVIAHRDSAYRGFVASSVPMSARPTLFFDRRAFAARRSALVEVGTPSPQLEDVMTDVDLGWRMWLAGRRILTSAGTTVVERAVAARPATGVIRAMRRAGAQHAAHRILVQALEPDNLARAVALTAALGAVDASTDSSNLLGSDRHAVQRPDRSEALDAMALPAALQAIGSASPELAAEREAIQAARTIGDDELFAEVGTVFRATLSETSDARALRRLIVPRPERTRPLVLILCSDDLGTSMAGPAIRTVEMARALLPGADPLIAAHRVDPAADLPCPAVVLSTDTLALLLPDVDAIVLQGPVTDWFPEVLSADVPIAVDLYDPMHLEALQRTGVEGEQSHVLNLVVEQLRRGDYFFCASERQRDFWLGMLSSLGRITPEAYAEDPDLRTLIGVVPFGIPREPPVRVGPGPRTSVAGIGPDDILLVWNGGLWDWFDTETFLQALAQVRDELPQVRAYFMGVLRPGTSELAPAARRVMALSDELGLTGTIVFFNDWTPYDTRQDVYLDATAVVSLHHAHLESRFSFRTRLLDALWGRVPIICTRGDVVAGIVEDLQLGLTVPPGDVGAVARALRELATDERLRARARVNLEAAAPDYEWAHAVAPLAAWLEGPRRTLGRITVTRGSGELARRQERREAVRSYASELKLLVPLPVREHVLGPARRRLQGALRAARSAR